MEDNFIEEYRNIKVGDLVTAAWSGYYKIISIQRRFYEGYIIPKGKNVGDEYSPLVTLIKKYREDGMPVTSKIEQRCDACYCVPMNIDIDNQIDKMQIVIERLTRLKHG